MSRILHRAGNLWEIQTPNQIVVHLVSAQGVWGIGFAAQLKKIAPRAFNDYKGWCEYKQRIPGEYCFFDQQNILSICTTLKVGREKDPPDVMLRAFDLGINKFHADYGQHTVLNFISVEIGSGHFAVPFDRMLKLIEDFTKKTKHKWTVVHPAK